MTQPGPDFAILFVLCGFANDLESSNDWRCWCAFGPLSLGCEVSTAFFDSGSGMSEIKNILLIFQIMKKIKMTNIYLAHLNSHNKAHFHKKNALVLEPVSAAE